MPCERLSRMHESDNETLSTQRHYHDKNDTNRCYFCVIRTQEHKSLHHNNNYPSLFSKHLWQCFILIAAIDLWLFEDDLLVQQRCVQYVLGNRTDKLKIFQELYSWGGLTNRNHMVSNMDCEVANPLHAQVQYDSVSKDLS